MPDPRTTDPRRTALPPVATPTPTTDSVPVVTRPSADVGSTRVTDGAAAPTAVGGEVETPKPLGLSVAQIAGGALAAVTAAVAASFLGVAGTLIGAALGSVVSSVAAAVYSTSLSRAARVSKVLVVRPTGSAPGPLEVSAEDPAAVPAAVPREPLAGPVATQWWTKVHWRPVAVVAGLLFVGAMAVVSVSELALGHPLGNASESGTTLTNLGGSNDVTPSPTGGTPGSSPTSTPSPTSSGPEASPTPSASDSRLDASPTSSPPPSATTGTTSSSPTTGTGTTTSTGTGTTAPAPTAPAPTPNP